MVEELAQWGGGPRAPRLLAVQAVHVEVEEGAGGGEQVEPAGGGACRDRSPPLCEVQEARANAGRSSRRGVAARGALLLLQLQSRHKRSSKF